MIKVSPKITVDIYSHLIPGSNRALSISQIFEEWQNSVTFALHFIVIKSVFLQITPIKLRAVLDQISNFVPQS